VDIVALAGLVGHSTSSVPGLLATVSAHADAVTEDVLQPLTWASAPRTWVFEPVPALAVAIVGWLYVAGVLRMRRRGDHWPIGRSLAFLVGGLGTLLIATQSFLAAYDDVLLSVHMGQHMLLAMVAPIFLALGAPITLALRTLRGSSRRLLLRVIHSRVAAVLTFPLVAGAIYIINPWVLYYSPLYEATLRNPLLHDLNHLHFVLVGCLWFWALLGIDPLPNRPSYPMRLIALFAMLPFHAFLGVTIMDSPRLLAEDYYVGLHRTWGDSLLADQQMAGGLLWSSGDSMAIVLLAVIFVQWSRASDREARAIDRRLDLAEDRAAAAAAAAAAVPVSVADTGPGTAVATVPGGQGPRAP
jgi:putative copper resistance protein D